MASISLLKIAEKMKLENLGDGTYLLKILIPIP